MSLTKVISGGQTGVDRAALFAASVAELETGGWAPRGWMTLAGPDPLLQDFGLVQHAGGYRDRTYANVTDADATLRLALTFNSKGERCTMDAIVAAGKPHMDVGWRQAPPAATFFEVRVEIVAAWIRDDKVEVLNVAGNSERTAPGIYVAAYRYLCRLFALCKE